MDKQKALKRLDVIEKEAEELRKILDGETVFDSTKNYVFACQLDGEPYIMASNLDIGHYRFQSFKNLGTGWDDPAKTGQGCLDHHAKFGTIYEFDGCIPAVEFFLEKRREYEAL